VVHRVTTGENNRVLFAPHNKQRLFLLSSLTSWI